MTIKSAHKLPSIAIPKLNLFVEAARSDVSSVWREDHMIHWLPVPDHLLDRHLARQLEKHESEVITTCNKPFFMVLNRLFVQLKCSFLFIFTFKSSSWLVTPSLDHVLR